MKCPYKESTKTIFGSSRCGMISPYFVDRITENASVFSHTILCLITPNVSYSKRPIWPHFK